MNHRLRSPAPPAARVCHGLRADAVTPLLTRAGRASAVGGQTTQRVRHRDRVGPRRSPAPLHRRRATAAPSPVPAYRAWRSRRTTATIRTTLVSPDRRLGRVGGSPESNGACQPRVSRASGVEVRPEDDGRPCRPRRTRIPLGRRKQNRADAVVVDGEQLRVDGRSGRRGGRRRAASRWSASSRRSEPAGEQRGGVGGGGRRAAANGRCRDSWLQVCPSPPRAANRARLRSAQRGRPDRRRGASTAAPNAVPGDGSTFDRP